MREYSLESLKNDTDDGVGTVKDAFTSDDASDSSEASETPVPNHGTPTTPHATPTQLPGSTASSLAATTTDNSTPRQLGEGCRHGERPQGRSRLVHLRLLRHFRPIRNDSAVRRRHFGLVGLDDSDADTATYTQADEQRVRFRHGSADQDVRQVELLVGRGHCRCRCGRGLCDADGCHVRDHQEA